MSLHITSINSGSNGNCYYIGNDRDAILVDAGISCRETERRMQRLGLSMERVRAIFVSHEHTDHIKGIPVLARKYNIPVYITEPTLQHGGLELDRDLVIPFRAEEPVQICGLRITAFLKHHDAADPHSFIVTGTHYLPDITTENAGAENPSPEQPNPEHPNPQHDIPEPVTIGVFTDIGHVCDRVIRYFQLCHAAFLETNYDEEMLEKGAYPYHLKNRIRSGKGHLSNRQALELFLQSRPAFMSHLFLSHLSQDNNDPRLVRQLFEEHAGSTSIIVASRHEETEVYHIKVPDQETILRNTELIRQNNILLTEQRRLKAEHEAAAAAAAGNMAIKNNIMAAAAKKTGRGRKKSTDNGSTIQISLF